MLNKSTANRSPWLWCDYRSKIKVTKVKKKNGNSKNGNKLPMRNS